MARKAKAKRVGRPSLSKDARRQVYSVRLPTALAARTKAYGGLTPAVEKALTWWLDEQARTEG